MADKKVLVNLSLLPYNELRVLVSSLARDNSPELERFKKKVADEKWRRERHAEQNSYSLED